MLSDWVRVDALDYGITGTPLVFKTSGGLETSISSDCPRGTLCPCPVISAPEHFQNPSLEFTAYSLGSALAINIEASVCHQLSRRALASVSIPLISSQYGNAVGNWSLTASAITRRNLHSVVGLATRYVWCGSLQFLLDLVFLLKLTPPRPLFFVLVNK